MAIQFQDENPYVAIVKEDGDGEQVSYVNVQLGHTVGQVRQIQPLGEDELLCLKTVSRGP